MALFETGTAAAAAAAATDDAIRSRLWGDSDTQRALVRRSPYRQASRIPFHLVFLDLKESVRSPFKRRVCLFLSW